MRAIISIFLLLRGKSRLWENTKKVFTLAHTQRDFLPQLVPENINVIQEGEKKKPEGKIFRRRREIKLGGE